MGRKRSDSLVREQPIMKEAKTVCKSRFRMRLDREKEEKRSVAVGRVTWVYVGTKKLTWGTRFWKTETFICCLLKCKQRL